MTLLSLWCELEKDVAGRTVSADMACSFSRLRNPSKRPLKSFPAVGTGSRYRKQ
ncbi:hypothetical protein K431DRAFT_281834 [Polychaeton citri CBS 116435]|uniref:Uncharacterized protein n=1 Tax=Polychaeton citri CBS 116435 TaxID=1314669 RepID=A0A9P4QDG8_9PEZI|nr:hypothetical protein K431DRAFT_281834 [Polychaeton citri CBS 116435]